MGKIEIDAEALYEAGEYIGYAFAALFRGIVDGMEAFDMAEAAHDIEEVHETEEPLKRPSAKTEIGDCRRCWCDQCAKLEQCTHIREGELPDGIRPFPCIGCENGMRFMPCEAEQCADFVQGEGLNNG